MCFYRIPRAWSAWKHWNYRFYYYYYIAIVSLGSLSVASWEICVEVRKEQLEMDMEQQTGSK